MCIRDSYKSEFVSREPSLKNKRELTQLATELLCIKEDCYTCLLYTSDAADERSSVDLGGRRIIKKTKDGARASGA